MSSETKLRERVEALIRLRLEQGRRAIPAAWLTQEVVRAHPLPQFDPETREFYRAGATAWVQSIVLGVVRSYEGDPQKRDTRQLVLPGYAHAQRCYAIQRKGKSIIVPIEVMTDGELEAKALELDRMSQGAAEHAFEIRRYALARRVTRKAG